MTREVSPAAVSATRVYRIKWCRRHSRWRIMHSVIRSRARTRPFTISMDLATNSPLTVNPTTWKCRQINLATIATTRTSSFSRLTRWRHSGTRLRRSRLPPRSFMRVLPSIYLSRSSQIFFINFRTKHQARRASMQKWWIIKRSKKTFAKNSP